MTLSSRGLTRSRDKPKTLYLHTTVPMTTKLSRMVTDLNGQQPMLLHPWFESRGQEIACQTKMIISPRRPYLWLPDLTGV